MTRNTLIAATVNAPTQLRVAAHSALDRVTADWAKLLGNVVVVTRLLDRLMHHGHLLRFEGKS
jgi:hypothetical protein